MKTKDIESWLGVSPAAISKLKKAGLPVESNKKAIIDWLKCQPLPARGRRPGWATIVKHPGLKKAATKVTKSKGKVAKTTRKAVNKPAAPVVAEAV